MVDSLIDALGEGAVVLALLDHDALEGGAVLVVAEQAHGPALALLGQTDATDLVLVFGTECLHLNILPARINLSGIIRSRGCPTACSTRPAS